MPRVNFFVISVRSDRRPVSASGGILSGAADADEPGCIYPPRIRRLLSATDQSRECRGALLRQHRDVQISTSHGHAVRPS